MPIEVPSPLDELLPRLFAPASTGETLRSATLTGLRQKSEEDASGSETFRRVDAKPITLKGATVFQFEYKFPAKVTHRNLTPDEAAAHARELLDNTFTQAVLRTEAAEYHLIFGRGAHKKGGKWTVRRKATAASAPGASATESLLTGDEHNRSKKYLLPEGEPAPFLVRLGVMTTEGQVIAAKRDKFRQINRFLEMVDDTLGALDTTRPLRIIDFGSGKSYLTFALYHLLHIRHGFDVTITGLDLKADVIAFCNEVSQDLGYADRLRFSVGEIADYGEAGERADMVVSLHACDTATDDALAKAVEWGASVILSVPCCQHEINSKLNPRSGGIYMRPLLKHGILKERLAALVTDAMRAEMLERYGYSVQVLEFIDMEHTPKNLLLRAVKRRSPDTAHERRVTQEYATFRDFWQIPSPHIETIFPQLPSSAATADTRVPPE